MGRREGRKEGRKEGRREVRREGEKVPFSVIKRVFNNGVWRNVIFEKIMTLQKLLQVTS